MNILGRFLSSLRSAPDDEMPDDTRMQIDMPMRNAAEIERHDMQDRREAQARLAALRYRFDAVTENITRGEGR